MRFICFLVALVAVAIASLVSENEEMDKRPNARLLGGGEGGGGGLLGGLIMGGRKGNLVEGNESGLLADPVCTITGQFSGLLDIVCVLSSLINGLTGKINELDITAEFEKYPEAKVCLVCDGLQDAQHKTSCKSYCSSQN